jgi:hypothetical protein
MLSQPGSVLKPARMPYSSPRTRLRSTGERDDLAGKGLQIGLVCGLSNKPRVGTPKLLPLSSPKKFQNPSKSSCVAAQLPLLHTA